MKIEILAGNGIKTAFKELGIAATKTYHEQEAPHFQVWEIEKSDVVKLEEVDKWQAHWGWWQLSKGSNMGTACGFLTINGEFLIGWDTESGNDTYEKLSDYFYDGLRVKSNKEVCSLAVDLARANGLSLAGLMKRYQG